MHRKFLFRTGIFVFLLFLSLFALVRIVNAYTDTYPYPNSSWTEADEWSFYKRECTSYVAWKINEEAGSNSFFTNGMVGPNGQSGLWGDAGNWVNNANNIGFPVDNTPRVGDIAWWSTGHVAYVESVNPDNTVNVTEYNWNNYSHNFGQRQNLVANKYIHIQPLAKPTVTEISFTASGQPNRIFQTTVKDNNDISVRSSTDGINWGSWFTYGKGLSDVNSVVFNGKLFQSVRGTDNYIYMRYTSNGTTWQPWFRVDGQTSHEVNLIVYRPTTSSPYRLYVSVRGLAGGVFTIYTENSTPTSPSSWTTWQQYGTSLGAVNTAIYNNFLYQAVRGSNGGVFVRAYSPSTGWAEWSPTNIFAKTDPDLETVAQGTPKLYVSFTREGGLISTANTTDTNPMNGISWQNWNNYGYAKWGVSMQFIGSTLYQSIVGKSPTNQVFVRSTTDGVNWTEWLGCGGSSSEVGLVNFNGNLHMAIRGNGQPNYVFSRPYSASCTNWQSVALP